MFNNKVVVITGAGGGIGRALAQKFAAEGAQLALSDINMVGLEETLKSLPASCKAKGYSLDASSWTGFLAHAEEVKTDFGTAHYIINNAGVTLVGTVANSTIEEYEWQLGSTMWGVLYGTKAFLPIMQAQREGCIVNISSVFGLVAYPAQSAYNMSKFAVRGLTECLWQELEGTGVRAVCVHPGGIKTNFEKAGRRVKAAGAAEEAMSSMGEKLLITPPEQCADDILNGLRKGHKRILTGNKSTTIFWLTRLFPNFYPTLMKLFA